MRRLLILTVFVCLCAALAFAQSRGGNWPTSGGDAQRSRWEGADARISKDTVKDLQLLFKIKLESQAKGSRPLLPPVIMGRLISYRGFRELAFVGSNADIVYAIDADLGTIFWQKHLEYSTREPQVTVPAPYCPGGMTSTPTMSVPGAAAPRGAGAPPLPTGRGGATPAGSFIAGTASVYAISSDGRLHRLNVSTGDDIVQPLQVLPANSRTSNLMMVNNTIYTVTSPACNLTKNAVWAIDLSVDPPRVTSFALNTGEVAGTEDPVIGSDGTVYVQTFGRLLALNAGDLALKGYFTLTNHRGASYVLLGEVSAALVFQFKNRDMIATVNRDHQLLLLDSTSLGADHETPLYQIASPPISGSLSTWQDADGTRWVLAPVWGRNGASPNGSITAFKVEEQAGKTVLTPAWVSRDMNSPLPPVIASGVVFALSAGKGGTRATLYALDAATGKELYSSRNLIAAPASLAGMSISNGRVYFSTLDGTMYAFGMFMEH
jgi:outer membrane protein assembly factor BamB